MLYKNYQLRRGKLRVLDILTSSFTSASTHKLRMSEVSISSSHPPLIPNCLQITSMSVPKGAENLPNPGPLTPSQRELVKATAPILMEHGTAITKCFYKQMLDGNPELKNVFNHSKQQAQLSLLRLSTHSDSLFSAR